MTYSEQVRLDTEGRDEVVDITGPVREIVARSEVAEGSVLVFVPGATGAVTTIEYEPGLIRDFPALMDRLIPRDVQYAHNETWGDGNGHSHLKASLVGPSLSIPVSGGEPLLGTWQQIVFMEFDNKPHHRNIMVRVSGE